MIRLATAPSWHYAATVWAVPDRVAHRAAALEGAELRALLAAELPRVGRVVSRRRGRNLVTDQGARWLLGHAFVTPLGTIPWFVMPKGAGNLANGDTMASHAGWSEITAYSQTARPALVLPAPSSGRSLSNSAAPAQITANASTTVHGLALTSSSTKNGTTGTLYGGANFASSQALTAGQILEIVATVSF